MAEALKTFREGEDILASETNENNQYLLSKLSDNAAQVQSYVEGEVATIKSNVASAQATLQNNIDELNEKVETKIVVIEAIKEGDKWCRVWSDGWKEQGGRATTGTTVVFLKPFSDADYTVVAQLKDNPNVAAYENISVNNITATSFKPYQYVWNQPCTWYACGY